MSEAAISLRGLRKTFGTSGGEVHAVDGVDLDIAEGEFLTLLGPSGSGKTTVLRMVAGFEQPTEGTILLGGRDVTGTAPFDRDVNTVFQDYALFPHMNVWQNVEYGLRVKKVAKKERRERVEAALAAAALPGYGDRRPAQLSGGQRQRVALARALVNRPRVLLLDEPFGALDLKLREAMQLELKEIQRSVGITFVFVTHDQQEALTMSDRIVVFDGGRIEQVGTPAQVYDTPGSRFVATFVGTSNLLDGEAATRVAGPGSEGGTFTIRPEKIRIAVPTADRGPDQGAADGTVKQRVYTGSSTRYVVGLDAGPEFVVVQQNSGADDAVPGEGGRVRLLWQSRDLYRIP